MKKRYTWLAAILLLVTIWPGMAFAAGEDAVTFSIDNGHVYQGMDKAYNDGYTPTVANGTATVILPLLSREPRPDSITATPNLGEPASSPFVYSNYQKTVTLKDNPVNGGGTVSGYLVQFDLPLSASRVNGTYPVSVDIAAQATDGTAIQQSFTMYVTVTDGKNPDAEPSEQPTTAPVFQPKILVSSYSVNPSPVTAGEDFTAIITLSNTSAKKSVQNMAVTVSCDCPNFQLLNDSSTIYIGKLGKGDTTQVELKYKTDLETAPGRYNISLAMEYDNSDATTLSSSGTVTVPVSQPLRVELEAPTIPQEVNAGDTMALSFQVMNMGRGKVYNVRIVLAAPGLIPSETAFIGNMEAGTAATGDMNVFVGTKTMTEGYEGDDKYGFTSGVITLTYEDDAGQEYTVDTDFNTMINEPVISASSGEVEEEPEMAGQWWISVVIGVVVIATLVTVLMVRAKKGKRDEER